LELALVVEEELVLLLGILLQARQAEVVEALAFEKLL
jgi:hypothetical protein